jgi:hypothetical protein
MDFIGAKFVSEKESGTFWDILGHLGVAWRKRGRAKVLVLTHAFENLPEEWRGVNYNVCILFGYANSVGNRWSRGFLSTD